MISQKKTLDWIEKYNQHSSSAKKKYKNKVKKGQNEKKGGGWGWEVVQAKAQLVKAFHKSAFNP